MTATQIVLRPFVVGLVLTLGLSAMIVAPHADAQPNVTNTLEGFVSDDMGMPLANANVEAKNASGTQTATTNEKGHFAITGLAPGQYSVTARKEGHLSQTREVTLLATETRFVDFHLELAGAKTIGGVVRNGEDGQPLEGAFVRANSYGEDGHYRFSENMTGADGKFLVKVWGSRAHLEVSRERFYSAYQEFEVLDNQTSDFSLTPIPKQTVKITGTVKDQDGNPVQAMINLRPDWERQSAGGGGSEGNATYATQECPPNADCAMSSPMYYQPGPENWNSTISDEQGKFEMMAYPGFVVLEANRRDFLVDSEKLELTEGETEKVALSLVKAPERTVTFKGKIVDAETGEPLPGAGVSLNNPEWADWNWITAGQDGAFEFQARHGYTLLRAEAHRWYYVETACAEPVQEDQAESTVIAPCPPGESGERDRDYFPHFAAYRTGEGQVVTVTIKLTPKPGFDAEIVGYVVDPATQKGIPNAQVYVSNQETWEWGQATTDEDGSYRVKVRSGFHVVTAHAEGFFENATTAVVGEGDERRLDLVLEKGESKQMGYWDPDGYGGCRYDQPCPMYETAHEAEMAPSPSSKGMTASAGFASDSDGGMESGARAFAAGDEARGDSAYEGSGGGLGPYRPATDENAAPGAGALLTLLGLVGALAVAAVRRRK